MMALHKICLTLVIMGSISEQNQNSNPTWSHKDYLNWLYTNFRNEFWTLGITTRQFAVVTVERLTQYPEVDIHELPLTNPDEWNAAYYAHTAPNHTEPVLFEGLANMILNYLQETNQLPINIYMFTYNIPCPLCTTTIMDFIRIHIPELIRQYVLENPQYNHVLQEIRNMHYRFSWNTERGNEVYTRATIEEFEDTNDDANDPGLTYYPRIRLNRAFACNLGSLGRKKRQDINVILLTPLLTTKWYQTDFKWKHVSAGVGGVWGVESTGKVFYRLDTYEYSITTGPRWQSVPGTAMKQLSVGYNSVWAVDSSDKIYRRDGITQTNPTGTSWAVINGLLTHVSVSPKGHVWGVNADGLLFKRTGDNWASLGGSFKQVSVGSAGVWTIMSDGSVCHRLGTFGDIDTLGYGWVDEGNNFTYISSGEGMVWGVVNDGRIVYRHGLSSNKPSGFSWVYIRGNWNQITVFNSGLWGVDSNSKAFGRLSAFGFEMTGWELIPGQAKHISTGFAGVWMIDHAGLISYRQSTYAADSNSKGSGEWEQLDGVLEQLDREWEQLDVGHRVVWGVDIYGSVYLRRGISYLTQTGSHWHKIPSLKLKCVTVSPSGHVWGTTSSGDIYRRVGANNKTPVGSSWKQIQGGLSQISAGNAGVWGVNTNNDVYYREGTSGDVDTDGSKWTKVDNIKMKYISSGPRCVRAVDLNNNIYYRSGMSLENPTGNSWIKPDSMQLKQVEIYDTVNGIWGLTSNGLIFARQF